MFIAVVVVVVVCFIMWKRFCNMPNNEKKKKLKLKKTRRGSPQSLQMETRPAQPVEVDETSTSAQIVFRCNNNSNNNTFSHMKIMTKCAAAAATSHRHRHRIIATIIAAIVMNFVIICIFMFGIGRKSMWQDHVPRTAFHVRSESCSTAPAQVGAALGLARPGEVSGLGRAMPWPMTTLS